MKFTILSHAGLLVEHAGTSVLCDPWLVGSCYWRSWWNFPEPPAEALADLCPDYIYLSHIHWDHFHGPSLRRFARETCILVPKFPSRRMVEDLGHLGFRNVRQVPHGGRVELGRGFELHSFQFGVIEDSAVVLTDGRTTLFDANDCKIFGLPLRQVRERFGTFDFVLRSHANAQLLPYCLEDHEQHLPSHRTHQDYIAEFTDFCLSLRARYALPFASNHCFLHRETKRFNSTLLRPTAISDHYGRRAHELGLESELVIMAPGSSWSEEQGFRLRAFDYEDSQGYLELLEQKHADKLRRQYELEDAERFDAQSFRSYFETLFRATRLHAKLRPFRVLFKIRDREGEQYWELDSRRGSAEPVPAPERFELLFEVHARVLNDCTKGMFRVWTPSKRIRVVVSDRRHLKQCSRFLGLLNNYEYEQLPLWKNLRPRSLGVRLRRWRELVEYARFAFRHRILRRPLVIGDLYARALRGAGPPRGRAGLEKPTA